MKNPKIDNYFIDIIYRLIPNVFKHYKLMTITCADNDTKNTFISGLVFLNFEDNILFTKIFKYLHEMFEFNPRVVHIDYFA